MIRLSKTIQAWGAANFDEIFKEEIQKLDRNLLPLQAGLSQSSYVSDDELKVILISASEKDNNIAIKAGVFYSGIIAGSCCADDPTPVDHQTEYCELLIELDKSTAEASIKLLSS